LIVKDVETFTGKMLRMAQREDENLDFILKEDEYGINHIPFDDGDVVIVVGAHVGGFTLLLTTLDKKLEIYSYEPVTSNYDMLIENIKKNPSDCNIHAFDLALSDRNEHKQVEWYQYANTARFITLNDIFNDNKIEKCKLVKFDCEGCEYDALGGATKSTLRKIQYIVGEWHWASRWQLHELVLPLFADRTEELGLKGCWQLKPPVGMFFFENYEKV